MEPQAHGLPFPYSPGTIGFGSPLDSVSQWHHHANSDLEDCAMLKKGLLIVLMTVTGMTMGCQEKPDSSDRLKESSEQESQQIADRMRKYVLTPMLFDASHLADQEKESRRQSHAVLRFRKHFGQSWESGWGGSGREYPGRMGCR